MTKEQKTYKGSLKFYEGEDQKKIGSFRAVFSTLNIKDLDGDVTLPGAFTDQTVAIESWDHGFSLPVGVGKIGFNEIEAWVDGAFFLNTQGGRDHYEVVKALPVTEWSYTFGIKASHFGDLEGQPVRYLTALDVAGVGPVTKGAGVNTRTVGIKGKGDEEGDDKPEKKDPPAPVVAEGIKDVRNFLAEALIKEIDNTEE